MRRLVAVAAALACSCAGVGKGKAPREELSLPSELALPWVGPVRHEPPSLRGKVVVVTFFATWCFPCLAQLPALDGLQRSREEKGLQVVAVGMDLEGRKVLEPFAYHFRYSFPVLVASQALLDGSSGFGRVQGLPQTLVFDREGRAIHAVAGVVDEAALARAVDKALGN